MKRKKADPRFSVVNLVEVNLNLIRRKNNGRFLMDGPADGLLAAVRTLYDMDSYIDHAILDNAIDETRETFETWSAEAWEFLLHRLPLCKVEAGRENVPRVFPVWGSHRPVWGSHRPVNTRPTTPTAQHRRAGRRSHWRPTGGTSSLHFNGRHGPRAGQRELPGAFRGAMLPPAPGVAGPRLRRIRSGHKPQLRRRPKLAQPFPEHAAVDLVPVELADRHHAVVAVCLPAGRGSRR